MQRQQQLTEWLRGLYPGERFTLAPASADASFRRYFRATFEDGQTRVVMDAPPQIRPEDVDELMRLIEQGKRPVRYDSPLAAKRER